MSYSNYLLSGTWSHGIPECGSRRQDRCLYCANSYDCVLARCGSFISNNNRCSSSFAPSKNKNNPPTLSSSRHCFHPTTSFYPPFTPSKRASRSCLHLPYTTFTLLPSFPVGTLDFVAFRQLTTPASTIFTLSLISFVYNRASCVTPCPPCRGRSTGEIRVCPRSRL